VWCSSLIGQFVLISPNLLHEFLIGQRIMGCSSLIVLMNMVCVSGVVIIGSGGLWILLAGVGAAPPEC